MFSRHTHVILTVLFQGWSASVHVKRQQQGQMRKHMWINYHCHHPYHSVDENTAGQRVGEPAQGHKTKKWARQDAHPASLTE